MSKTYGFGLVIECGEAIDEVDIRRIMEDAFKQPLWADVTKFDVVPIGELDQFPDELSKGK
jgi:hypothetical protein